MNKHTFESSQHGQRNEESENSIISVPAGAAIRRTQQDLERLRWLASRPDSEIDFSDIPSLTSEEYLRAKRTMEQSAAKLRKAS